VDLDAVIFNPISLTVLKLLTLKCVSWKHDFQPCTAMVWDCLIVGLLWLHHVQSLANVTMAATAIGKADKLVLPRTSCKLNNKFWEELICLISLHKSFI
jgi:hypothetical protein